jgi:hypothetical protein
MQSAAVKKANTVRRQRNDRTLLTRHLVVSFTEDNPQTGCYRLHPCMLHRHRFRNGIEKSRFASRAAE